MTQIYILAPILILTIVILATSIKVLREYERGVTFTLGRFTSVKGPGIIILIPFIQTMNRVDLRTLVVDVPTQDVISKDNVSVKVNAVIYFRIVENLVIQQSLCQRVQLVVVFLENARRGRFGLLHNPANLSINGLSSLFTYLTISRKALAQKDFVIAVSQG